MDLPERDEEGVMENINGEPFFNFQSLSHDSLARCCVWTEYSVAAVKLTDVHNICALHRVCILEGGGVHAMGVNEWY